MARGLDYLKFCKYLLEKAILLVTVWIKNRLTWMDRGWQAVWQWDVMVHGKTTHGRTEAALVFLSTIAGSC